MADTTIQELERLRDTTEDDIKRRALTSLLACFTKVAPEPTADEAEPGETDGVSNGRVGQAHRDGMNPQRVKDAVARLTEKAALENATRIAGLIETPVEQLTDEYNQAAGSTRRLALSSGQTSNWRGNGVARSALD